MILYSILLAVTIPTISITSPVQIYSSINDANRNVTINVTVTGATNTIVTISTNGTTSTSTTFNNQSITVPIPSDASTYVQVSYVISFIDSILY